MSVPYFGLLPTVRIQARLVQFENAQLPMEVTFFGMVTFVRPLVLNAYWPIVLSRAGRLTVFSEVFPANASEPMVSSVVGRSTLPSSMH